MVRDNKLDVVLVKKGLRGDRKALADLINHYQRPVYNAAYRIVGNDEDAADVTQTVFLKVFKNLQDYNPQYKFFSWIYRIAINESINLTNKRMTTETLPEQQASTSPGPEEQLTAKRRDAELQTALMKLNLEYRTVVIFKHMLGFSYNQLSELLQVPEKTVKSRLYTARQLLKQDLLDAPDVDSAMDNKT